MFVFMCYNTSGWKTLNTASIFSSKISVTAYAVTLYYILMIITVPKILSRFKFANCAVPVTDVCHFLVAAAGSEL